MCSFRINLGSRELIAYFGLIRTAWFLRRQSTKPCSKKEKERKKKSWSALLEQVNRKRLLSCSLSFRPPFDTVELIANNSS